MMENNKISAYAGMTPEVLKKFKYWQNRTIIATMIGYAMFYFVRKNLSVAMPFMEKDLGITKVELGTFLTLHLLIYGVSRFLNGMIGDRVNSRMFMVAGLLLCSVCNIIFGFSSAVLVFGIVWLFNGWFQGMGFPPCVRLLTHWIPPQQLATKMSVWNTSHSIGAGLVVIVCGYVGVHLGWRWCFFIPSIIAVLGALFLLLTLRDTPKSVDLPELNTGGKHDDGEEDKNSKEYKQFVKKQVFKNPYIWILGLANFFVYIVRFAILDWGPTLLQQWKGIPVQHGGWLVAGFEISGIVGMITAGWITDRVFGGRGPRTCLFCMLFATLFMFIFWQLEAPSMWLALIVLMAAGFCIYGPQALIGISASNIATKRAAGTAAGFTGLFGYACAPVTGVGLGYMAEHFGWSSAMTIVIGAGVIGTLVFLMAWKAKANGYEDAGA